MLKRIILFIFIFACAIVISSGSAAAASSNNTTTTLAALNNTTNQTTANASPAGDNLQATSGSVLNNQTKVTYSKIQDAINAATSGNTLIINPGTYNENQLTISKNLNIFGSSETNTIINAANSNLVFWIKSGAIVRIENLNITNGLASNGGGIYNEGTLTLTNITFYKNSVWDGSAANGLHDASAAGNGGAIYNTGTLTITNCDFMSNHAGKGGDASATHHSSWGGYGGAIYNTGTILNIQNSTFSNNYAGNGGKSSGTHDGSKGGDGGAIYSTGTINNILGCSFTNNHAGNGGSVQAGAAANGGVGGSGGAIYSNKIISVNNSTFKGNYAGNGGEGSTANGGSDGGNGGAIYNAGTLTITNSEISNNNAGNGGDGYGLIYKGGNGGNGGAIYNAGTFTITNSEIQNNTAGIGGTGHAYESLNTYDGDNGKGGGIYNNANLTIHNSKIQDNSAENGGGIYNNGNSNITNTSFTNNTAQYRIRYYNGASTHPLVYILYGGEGGAVWNNGNLILMNNSFTNNTAMYGGALYYTGNGTYNVTNCSFNNNTVEAVDDYGNPLQVVTYSFTGSGLDFISAVVKTVAGVVDLSSANPVNGILKIVESVNSVVKMIKTDTNTVEAAGGAIYMLNSINLSVNNCNFANNAASLGGGIANFGTGALNVTSSTFTNNPAGMGGAVYCNDLAPSSVTNSIFNGNCADGGAAISYTGSQSTQWGTLNATENIFQNNHGSLGGVVYDNFQGNTKIHINYNRIYGTENYDIYDEVGKADAEFNWWGSNKGPETYNAYGNIDTSNWMVLTINSPNVDYGDNSTITLEMLYDNNGTYHDPAYGVVPDGIPLNLTVTSGTITANTCTLINGTATVTYTANGNYTGPVTISAIVDNNLEYPVNSTFIVNKIPTDTYMNPLYGNPGGTVSLTALVENEFTYKPINDGYVIYQIGTEPQRFTAPVIDGYATYNWTIPSNANPGYQYNIFATYNGTNIYNTSQVITYLIINKVTTADIVITNIIDKAKCNNGTTTVWPPTYGCSMYYYVTLHNNGPSNATGIVVTDMLPSTVNYANYWVSTDNGTTWKAAVNLPDTYNPTTGIWNVGNLNFGAPDEILSIRAIVNASNTWINNTATITALNEYDPSTPDTSTATVYIPPLTQSDLTINPKVPSMVYLDENFIVNIKVGNNGPDTAKDVIINIPIPEAFQFITATVDQGTWSYNESTRILTWNIGDVPVGDPHLYITLKPIALGTYQINHLLTSITYDPNINNNITPITITIKEPENQENPTNQTVNSQSQNIPMQKTGTPITPLILALLAIIGGSVYNRLR